MQKEYVIQFYKTINKLLCNLSFACQYIYIHMYSQLLIILMWLQKFKKSNEIGILTQL